LEDEERRSFKISSGSENTEHVDFVNTITEFDRNSFCLGGGGGGSGGKDSVTSLMQAISPPPELDPINDNGLTTKQEKKGVK